MPDGNTTEHRVLNKSHVRDPSGNHKEALGPSRRTSSTVSTRSQRRSPSPSEKTPLTPEESPPFRTTRKRNAGIVEDEDKEIDSANTTPAHTRANSGDSTAHVCICQPDPKIPRPRNAFILYRQHHQASVVAQHPGLANPEISKIIGEQWQNQPAETKNKWKALAEEEKLRHQQQYPTYRYQPKRNGRRNSLSADANGEKPKCQKCGGRSILAPSTPYSNAQSNGVSPISVPPTPGSAITPVSRTLPVLRDLSLQSPAVRRMGRVFQPSNMSPHHNGRMDDRDEIAPLSPDNKRGRYNGDHPPQVTRAMPPRYGVPAPGPLVGPGTPFPFGQPPPPHPYPPAVAHVRRESLPGLQGIANPPGPMAPPPRPGPGYQQHRMSQGHIPHDRSLTLPPLQTGSISGPSGAAAAVAGKTAEEQIMAMPFRYKVGVLGQVAPPAPKDSTPRGPLIAIEGDSAEAVAELGKWLHDELKKSEDLTISSFDSPNLLSNGEKKKPMVQYHLLATEWLSRSDEIVASITYKSAAAHPVDSAMSGTSPIQEPAQSARDINENYDDESTPTEESTKQAEPNEKPTVTPTVSENEKMDVDKTPTANAPQTSSLSNIKPVGIIANYSLHASNVFACRIPIGPHDPYSPSDHWQWTATQWRGVVGPDLTIFVRDALVGESGKNTVEMLDENNLFVVKRARVEEGKHEMEASTLRRLSFEVGEWVRLFGSDRKGSV